MASLVPQLSRPALAGISTSYPRLQFVDYATWGIGMTPVLHEKLLARILGMRGRFLKAEMQDVLDEYIGDFAQKPSEPSGGFCAVRKIDGSRLGWLGCLGSFGKALTELPLQSKFYIESIIEVGEGRIHCLNCALEPGAINLHTAKKPPNGSDGFCANSLLIVQMVFCAPSKKAYESTRTSFVVKNERAQ
ncbi:hypothetical protein C8J57DRAFT_1238011 [Mycena rebaudengoi]|nr:hypothetical protein C8J57DRAFT_1238011 [Mycena rebaudengoi]